MEVRLIDGELLDLENLELSKGQLKTYLTKLFNMLFEDDDIIYSLKEVRTNQGEIYILIENREGLILGHELSNGMTALILDTHSRYAYYESDYYTDRVEPRVVVEEVHQGVVTDGNELFEFDEEDQEFLDLFEDLFEDFEDFDD